MNSIEVTMMNYPSAILNDARAYRSKYLRRAIRLWVQKLRARLANRQAQPVFVQVSRA